METNVNYTIVGAFVIMLVALIILGIIWLSAGFSSEHYTMYEVYMKEPVSGLNIDAPVEFNGVNVGVVPKIKLNRANPQIVEIQIKVKKDTPVTRGTRAKLGIRFLSGIAYILLEDKGTDRRPLLARPGERYPVIDTTPSILVKFDSILTQLNTSLNQIIASLRSILDSENIKGVKQIIKNMRKATEEMSPFLRSGQSTIRSFQKTTLPITNQAITNFGDMSNRLEEISTMIKQNPAVLIRGKQPRPLGPGER